MKIKLLKILRKKSDVCNSCLYINNIKKSVFSSRELASTTFIDIANHPKVTVDSILLSVDLTTSPPTSGAKGVSKRRWRVVWRSVITITMGGMMSSLLSFMAIVCSIETMVIIIQYYAITKGQNYRSTSMGCSFIKLEAAYIQSLQNGFNELL